MSKSRFYAKIELNNIGKNVSGVRSKIGHDTKIMAVVKADAYGHGAVQIAKYLDDKVEWFGVSNIDEALELRNNGIEKDILILGAIMPDDYSSIVKYDVTATVFDYERANLLNKEANLQNKVAKVHIKVDTGMSRIGFLPDDLSADTVLKISQLPNIALEGIFSPLARADEADKTSAKEQQSAFDTFIKLLEERNINIP